MILQNGMTQEKRDVQFGASEGASSKLATVFQVEAAVSDRLRQAVRTSDGAGGDQKTDACTGS